MFTDLLLLLSVLLLQEVLSNQEVQFVLSPPFLQETLSNHEVLLLQEVLSNPEVQSLPLLQWDQEILHDVQAQQPQLKRMLSLKYCWMLVAFKCK